MTLLDKLRQHAGIPDAYSWATIALTVDEARAMVSTDNLLRARVAERDTEIAQLREDVLQRNLTLDSSREEMAQLRAELAAATRWCTDCGRSSRELTPWEEQGQVVAWLGPSCHRRRVEAGPATALPLGGVR